MVIGVANSVFLDTNILVYANVSESPFHQTALQAIENLYDAGIFVQEGSVQFVCVFGFPAG